MHPAYLRLQLKIAARRKLPRAATRGADGEVSTSSRTSPSDCGHGAEWSQPWITEEIAKATGHDLMGFKSPQQDINAERMRSEEIEERMRTFGRLWAYAASAALTLVILIMAVQSAPDFVKQQYEGSRE